MPDGTPLEQTARVAQALGDELARQPDVLNYQTYTGTSGPYNFNGLVRHYYMRRQSNQADIQVNLLPAKQRSVQSHAIAKRLRPVLDAIGNQYGARIQVSEVPPGPPVDPDAGGRGLRSGSRWPDPGGTADQVHLPTHSGRCGHGLVRRRSAAKAGNSRG